MGKMRMALVALLGVVACGKGRGDAGQGTGGPYDLVLKGGLQALVDFKTAGS